MSRRITVIAFCVVTCASSTSRSQVADPANGTNVNGAPPIATTPSPDANPNRAANLGTSNPSASGTATNPALSTNSGVFDAQRMNSQDAATQGAGAFRDGQSITGNTMLDDRAAVDHNDWRMVLHNGRWWYWTPSNTWLYRRGEQWTAFVPHGMDQRVRANNFDGRSQYRSGYRGDTVFQDEAMLQNQNMPQNDRGLRTSVGDPQLRGQAVPRTGLNTNAVTPGFQTARPLAPTANELQNFYRRQGIQATPYGGTTGGARNATPLGGGTTRNAIAPGTAGPTGPAPLGTPQSTPPRANPTTSSPGNPGAIGSPGNPAAAGPAGSGSGANGAAPVGGTGTSGAGGTGTGGASGSGS